MSDLRDQLIKLGTERPDLREDIRPILASLKQAGHYDKVVSKVLAHPVFLAMVERANGRYNSNIAKDALIAIGKAEHRGNDRDLNWLHTLDDDAWFEIRDELEKAVRRTMSASKTASDSDLHNKIRVMEKAMKLDDKYAAELPSEDTLLDNPGKYTGDLRRKLKMLGKLDKDLKKAYAAYTSVKVG